MNTLRHIPQSLITTIDTPQQSYFPNYELLAGNIMSVSLESPNEMPIGKSGSLIGEEFAPPHLLPGPLTTPTLFDIRTPPSLSIVIV
ncbi:hypothetical protein CEXT_518441 [Caerostris extrusa]|uniref:Uncharacterized protein n=1 Tax=Caerostris extrusa TaxID=172846 RepID=A0AAV4TYM6_CAEEX|nr:hypothetical protein CEXT_518441 [Caerostris extrusa]